jgi:hypothetical protein
MKLPFWAIVMITIGLSCSCKKKEKHVRVERAFYYWKSSEYSLGDNQAAQLKTLKVKKLYVKFFEVQPDPVFINKPISKTTLHIWWNDSLTAGIEVIPTVYIQNETLQKLTSAGTDSLADNIIFLVNKFYKSNIRNGEGKYKEIQIDCDWTKSTKDNYFALLKAIKKHTTATLSCTLRLYPYKYENAMGTPPVDKAMLMCYNLVNPLSSTNKNSILENAELKKYLRKNKTYPLHLDIAFPVYSWAQVYKDKVFSGVINTTDIDLSNAVKPIQPPLWYEVKNDMDVGNMYLREGDRIKMEGVGGETLNETIDLLKNNLELDSTVTISFFHLNGKNFKYTNETLNKLYTRFGN